MLDMSRWTPSREAVDPSLSVSKLLPRNLHSKMAAAECRYQVSSYCSQTASIAGHDAHFITFPIQLCRREKYCDFCSCQLPDWKSILTPCGGAGAPAVMNVNFDNKTYSFQVSPGADGYKQFTEAIRKAFHLPDDSELNITFTCDEPSSGGTMQQTWRNSTDEPVCSMYTVASLCILLL